MHMHGIYVHVYVCTGEMEDGVQGDDPLGTTENDPTLLDDFDPNGKDTLNSR
jgi:hypothetical protein